jgi:hypothetical protein
VDEHSRTRIRAVVQKSHYAGIVEILVANVVADLYTKVSGLHAAADFLASRVNILQRYLAK